MGRYFLFRILQSLGLMIGILMLVFMMLRLTGDPASLMLSREATLEQRDAFRETNGFDRPVTEQFVAYFSSVLRGDLGMSMSLGLPNQTLIMQRLPATFELTLAALGLAIAIGIPLGLLSGSFPGSIFDLIARGLGLAGQTIPSFWLAMILILVFAVNLRLLPSFGRGAPNSIILPALTLALGLTGQLVRLTRATVLEIQQENYIRTAHSKGLTPKQVALGHVLPNAGITLVSVIGVQFAYLMGGAVYVETIFAWPGLGSLLNNAITDTDFPLVQAITIFITLIVIMVNFLTDLVYGWVDPRVRQRQHG